MLLTFTALYVKVTILKTFVSTSRGEQDYIHLHGFVYEASEEIISVENISQVPNYNKLPIPSSMSKYFLQNVF